MCSHTVWLGRLVIMTPSNYQLEVAVMPLCDKKMNVRGTLRCEEEAGHYGAHSCQVTKAPKRNGKVMR